MTDLASWRERVEAVEQGEPLYVTPAEFDALRRVIAAFEDEHPETWRPAGEVAPVSGIPVVILR